MNVLRGDWLGAGHAEIILQGHFRNAFGYYSSAAKASPAEFESLFLADMPVLEKLGYDVKAGRILCRQDFISMRMMISG